MKTNPSPITKQSPIFISGGSGLAGSAIVRLLTKRGYENLLFPTHSELDLLDSKATHDYFEKHRPALVIHCAGRVGGIVANVNQPFDFLLENILMGLQVVSACVAVSCDRLINLGSSCMYSPSTPLPLREENLFDGSPEETNKSYAQAKLSIAQACESANRQFGTHFQTLIPCNLYGPNDNFHLRDSHVLAALIRKMFLAKWLSESRFDLLAHDLQPESLENSNQSISKFLNNQGIEVGSIRLHGDGYPRREFLHSDDLALFVCLCVESPEKFCERINVGTGQEVSIRELALLVRRSVGFEGEVLFGSAEMNGVHSKVLDSSRARQIDNFQARSLSIGISQEVSRYHSTAVDRVEFDIGV